MHQPILKCDNCGKALDAKTQVCQSCEEKLFEELEEKFVPLPFTCPACKHKVPNFKEIPWPEKAPWYKLISHSRLRCPHCQSFVKIKDENEKNKHLSMGAYFSMLILAGSVDKSKHPFLHTCFFILMIMSGIVLFYFLHKKSKDAPIYEQDLSNK